MGYTGRTRQLDEHSIMSRYFIGPSPSTYNTPVAGHQATISRGNPAWLAYKRTGRKSSRHEMGGGFTSIKHEMSPGTRPMSGSNGSNPSGGGYRKVEGHFFPFAPSITGSWVVPSNQYIQIGTGNLVIPPSSIIEGRGATAISQCAPTNPHAGLATAIGELKNDGLPSITSSFLRGESRGSLKGLAEDNLNYQFALKPFYGDLKDFHTAIVDRKKILAQYARDSGRPVRRTYRFPVETTTSTQSLGADLGPWPNTGFAFQSYGQIQRINVFRRETWFVGSFVYHRAGGDGQWNTILQKYQDMNHLLGTGLGPSTYWNLAPWSWAVDWFSNVGDVLNNIQMMVTDGLIMEYGYVMMTETTETYWMRTGSKPYAAYSSYWDLNPWISAKTTTKKWRRQANPFGFGIEFPDLDFRKMSILASLGITRSSRVP